MSQEVVQQFLEYVVSNIIQNKDELVIEQEADEHGINVIIKVDKDDMGRLIGKNGQTAKSLRTLLRVIGIRNDQSIRMKILDPVT